MIIRRKDYQAERSLEYSRGYASGYGRGWKEGYDKVLDIIRNSYKVTIVHGNFIAKDKSVVENCTVFVIPTPPVGIKVEGGAKDVKISGNTISSL